MTGLTSEAAAKAGDTRSALGPRWSFMNHAMRDCDVDRVGKVLFPVLSGRSPLDNLQREGLWPASCPSEEQVRRWVAEWGAP